MKKLSLFTVILAITLLLIGNSNFAYAEGESTSGCDACNTTSPYIDNYVKFSYEIIQAFQTYANKQESVLQTQGQTLVTNGADQINTNNDGRFVKTDEYRALQSVVDNLNSKAQSIASSAFAFGLISSETAFGDSWKNIFVLMSSKAILRDRQKVDTVGQTVANTLLDLGNAGVFQRLGFRDGWDSRIEEILIRYSNMENAPIHYEKASSFAAQPRDILGGLWRMSQALKTTLAIGNKVVDDTDNTFMNGLVTFSQGAQETIPPYYTCARGTSGFSCSNVGKKAKENLENNWKDTKKGATDAKTKIKNALKRLSGFWSSNDQTKAMFKQRQDELLRAEYGRQGVRNNQGDSIVSSLWDSWKTLKQESTEIGPFAGFQRNNPQPAGDGFLVGDIKTTQIINQNKNSLKDSFDTTLTVARKNRQQSVYSDVSPITKVFPQITQEIVIAKYIVDDSKPSALTQNLGKACDLQCANLGGKCWYQ